MQKCERLNLELNKAQMAIDWLVHHNITVSVPFANSPQNDDIVVSYELKELIERRIAKQRLFENRYMNQRELNAEI